MGRVRVERAIDAFLDWRQLERDATPRSLDSYRRIDELAEALDRAAASRHAQASPDLTTLEGEVSDELETLRWRRRESNPRTIPTECRDRAAAGVLSL
jgi:hypothetical protein